MEVTLSCGMKRKAHLTLELESLYLDPETEVLCVAVAAPGVPTQAKGAEGRQCDERTNVQHSQVVAADVQHLQRQVFRESIRMNLGECWVVCHSKHNETGQRPERPVLDLSQSVEGQVQIGKFAQVAKGRFRYLGEGVVAAVQVHQVRQVVELQSREVPNFVVGDDKLPGGEREICGEQR